MSFKLRLRSAQLTLSSATIYQPAYMACYKKHARAVSGLGNTSQILTLQLRERKADGVDQDQNIETIRDV